MPAEKLLEIFHLTPVIRRQSRTLEILYLIGGAFMIFALPYYVPMKRLAFSPSYDFGFNNHIAVCDALVWALAAPLFFRRKRRLLPANPIDFPDQSAPSPRFFYLMAALHMVGIAFYSLASMVDSNLPDGTYFLTNAVNMAQGLRPYTEFEFAYGPALVYPTHWLNAAGLSVHSAYFLFYLVITFVGLYMVWSFVNYLPVRTTTKVMIFLMVSGISLISLPTGGVSYTIVRFVTPLWFLGKLNAIYMRRRPQWEQIAVSAFGILATDLVSPEIGTVFTVTVVIFFALTWAVESGDRLWRSFAMLSCVGVHALFFFVLMPPQFRDAMVSFSHGGNNFPVVPSVLDIGYLAGAAYCYKRYVLSFLQGNFIFSLILIYGLGSLPGALTHADSGHVAWDGLSIFVLLIVANERSGKARRLSFAFLPVVLFALGTPFLPGSHDVRLAARSVIGLLANAPTDGLLTNASHWLPARMGQRLTGSVHAFRDANIRFKDDVAVARSFPTSSFVGSPDIRLEEQLVKVNLEPLYYFGDTNVFDSRAVTRALDNLKTVNASLLVMGDTSGSHACPSEALEQRTLSRSLFYRYRIRRKHDSCEIYEPVYAYVREQYQPLPGYPEFWIRKKLETVTKVGVTDIR
jgi:hypothetical protein